MTKAAIAAGLLWAATVCGADLATHTLPVEVRYPEGIAYDRSAGVIYTGSALDGAIVRIDVKSGRSETIVKPDTLFQGKDQFPALLGMALDRSGRLWIAGGRTANVFVIDAKSGDVLKTLSTGSGGFLNDLAFVGEAVYVTDTLRPTLWRVEADKQIGEPQAWLDLSRGPIEYIKGANLNGIAATPDGKTLIVVHMQKGELFTIDVASRKASTIDVKGETLTGADGLVLDGMTLYVVRQPEAEIVSLALASDLSSAEVISRFKHPDLLWPATAAKVGDHLVVVNTQFNRRSANNPQTPFTLSGVPLGQLQGK